MRCNGFTSAPRLHTVTCVVVDGAHRGGVRRRCGGAGVCVTWFALFVSPCQRDRVRVQAVDVPVLYDAQPLPAPLCGEYFRYKPACGADPAVHDAGVPVAGQGVWEGCSGIAANGWSLPVRCSCGAARRVSSSPVSNRTCDVGFRLRARRCSCSSWTHASPTTSWTPSRTHCSRCGSK